MPREPKTYAEMVAEDVIVPTGRRRKRRPKKGSKVVKKLIDSATGEETIVHVPVPGCEPKVDESGEVDLDLLDEARNEFDGI